MLIKSTLLNSHTGLEYSAEIVSVAFLRVKAILAVVEIVTGLATEPWADEWKHVTSATADVEMAGRHHIHFCRHSCPVALLWEVYSDAFPLTTHAW